MRDIRPKNTGKLPPNVPPPPKSASDAAPKPKKPTPPPVPSKKPRFSGANVPVASINVPKATPPPAKKTPKAIPPKNLASAIKGTLAPFARTGVEEKKVAKLQPKRPPVQLKPAKEGPPEMTPSKQKRPPAAKASRKTPRLGSRERSIILVLLALVLLTGVLAAYIFLPKADVQLILRTAPLLVDETVAIQAAEPGTDAIPGTSFFREVEVSGSTPVTSTEIIGSKTTGSVVLINRTFDEQQIKEQSRLITDDGTLFYMQGDAVIPPAVGSTLGSTTVVVEAAEAGSESNIEPQQLNFAALDETSQKLVYAEVRTALTGGSGDQVHVVKDADLAAAETAAGEQARAQVEADIRAELPSGWVILDESWDTETAGFTTDAELDQRTDAIAYTARVTARVIGYEAAALETFLRTSLEQRVEEEYMLFPGPISFSKAVEEVDWETGTAQIATRVTHATIPELSLNTLKEKLSGRSQGEARQYLEGLPGVRSVTIKLWPFWATSIPRLESRINLDLEPERQ